MKCRSKYSPSNIFEYSIEDNDNIKIYKDDFQVEISKQMFDEMWESYTD